ncbi:MAG: hypothetical protein ACYC26_09850 [Phycisphaerales bacterium]
MNWQTIRRQFEEIREDHGGASVEVRCFVVGDGDYGWVSMLPLMPHVYSGPTACWRLWPEPGKWEPGESAYGKERKEGEPPEPLKPVVLMGPYRAIELWGKSDEAIEQFVKAAHEAGVELPPNERERASIPPEAKPAIRWIFWLVHVLKDHPRKFIEITGDPTAKENPQLVHKVNKAIIASMTGIEEAGLTAQHKLPSHASDFTSVEWGGQRYSFNKTQADCVRLLWEEWQAGRHGLSEKTIGDQIGSGSDSYRLLHTFRVKAGGTHPAWGVMIQAVGKGIYALCAPDHK